MICHFTSLAAPPLENTLVEKVKKKTNAILHGISRVSSHGYCTEHVYH